MYACHNNPSWYLVHNDLIKKNTKQLYWAVDTQIKMLKFWVITLKKNEYTLKS